MSKMKIGIIGGSGLDDPDILEGKTEKIVETPYGKPSDALIIGKIKGVECVLLARHGRKHDTYPSTVNYRANLWALKEAGCTHVVVTTACGSLQEDYAPGDIVFLNSFIDRTYKREQTFYDGQPGSPKGVMHIPMHQPFCRHMRALLIETAKDLEIPHHETGTNVTIEGPRFSSKAESKVFQSWGGSIINMTTVPEVVLANELGMCYAAIALVTDYDCWRDVDEEEHVNVEAVLKTFKENAVKAKSLLVNVIPKIAAKDWTDILAEKQKIVEASNMSK